MNVNNVQNSSQDDCLACRIISGSCLIGVSLYITNHSKKFNNKNFSRYVMLTIAGGTFLLGTARLFNLPPFGNVFNSKSASV